METQLYPGIAFSPPAALTDNIGAGDTIIPVSDAGSFPPAPNLATIGADEDGETILYAAKTATALSGCVRGVEGTARAWSAGEPIARNWTAKDHNDLIGAVGEAMELAAQPGPQGPQGETGETGPKGDKGDPGTGVSSGGTTGQMLVKASGADYDTRWMDVPAVVTSEQMEAALSSKQDALRGRPGQVVGFGAEGAAQAVSGWSNPNLLDNWYFSDPINQRGRTEYNVAGVGYTIDRWLLSQAGAKVLSVIENGISIEPGGVLAQKLEPGRIQDGTQITMSVMINYIVFSAGMRWDSSAGYTSLTTQYGFRLACDPSNRYVQIYNESGSGDDVINAVKLEHGPVQTLARQDASGNWVLNDPPPNKALELAKCQRYQVAFSVPYTVIGSGFAINSTTAHIHFVLANLAGNAAVSIKNIYLVSANHPGANGIIATEIDTLYGENGTFGTIAYCAGGLTPGAPLLLQLRTNSYFIADKNL